MVEIAKRGVKIGWTSAGEVMGLMSVVAVDDSASGMLSRVVDDEEVEDEVVVTSVVVVVVVRGDRLKGGEGGGEIGEEGG